MAWYAATRLTLTKSHAEEKPVVEKDEPFPSLSYYSDDDMKTMEANGYVYQQSKAEASKAAAAAAVEKPAPATLTT